MSRHYFNATIEVDVLVEVEVLPGEKEWFNPIEGVGHPGCAPCVSVINITTDEANEGVNIPVNCLSKANLEYLEETSLEQDFCYCI